MAKKKFGPDIEERVIEAFYAFCERRGYSKSAAATAAFRLLEWSPPELREHLMEGDEEAVRDWFSRAIDALMAQAVAAAKKRNRKDGDGGRASRQK